MQNDVRLWRAREGLSQGELAAAVGVSRQSINAIERDRSDPSLALAFELAAFFGCDVETLFHYDPDAG